MSVKQLKEESMILPKTYLTVQPDWIDYNGHMNVAYYVLAFDLATDAVYERWGIGATQIADTGCSVFTLGMNVDYVAELFKDDPILVTTQLLDWDYKRVHYYHRMTQRTTGKLVATNECLGMSIDLESRRSAPFSESVQQILAATHAEHQTVPQPASRGRQLGIRRKTG